jgi:molybdopterin-guanine dinucleotide biosynthesis protein A
MDVDALLVSDHFRARSSLNGLYAGLFAAKHENAFFTACDTPFARERLIRHLLSAADKKTDIVLPSTAAGVEPLFAVYKKSCLPAMEWQLENDRVKISGLFRKLKVKTVKEQELRAVDPELVSFFNLNTPEDLILAEERLHTLHKGEGTDGCE